MTAVVTVPFDPEIEAGLARMPSGPPMSAESIAASRGGMDACSRRSPT